MTSNKEDYLKAIFDAEEDGHYVSNKTLACRLGVAPASVSEMLSRLEKEGLIEYRAYHGSRLTEQGLACCLDVVRSHGLWEVFLIRYLGCSWWEAHEEAHLLEHAASPETVDRLDAFLGYPEVCPHGGVIPRAGKPSAPSGEPLSRLKTGDSAVIARISESRELLDYLEPLGILPGETITVTDIAPYEGPVTFRQNGKPISVSHKAATEIFVKSVQPKESGKTEI